MTKQVPPSAMGTFLAHAFYGSLIGMIVFFILFQNLLGIWYGIIFGLIHAIFFSRRGKYEEIKIANFGNMEKYLESNDYSKRAIDPVTTIYDKKLTISFFSRIYVTNNRGEIKLSAPKSVTEHMMKMSFL